MLNYSNNNHKTINLMETITIHYLKILIQTIEKNCSKMFSHLLNLNI